MRAFLAVVLVALTLVAGCSSSEEPEPVPDPVRSPQWATDAIFLGADPESTDFVPDHDHNDRAIHQGYSTPNFELLGHDPLLSSYYRASAGTAWCGDVAKASERRLAVVHSFSTDVALTVIDVTDPKLPTMVGELVLPYDFTYDVAIFEDGKYAVIAGNPDLASDPPPTRLANGDLPWSGAWRDACGSIRPVQGPADGLPHGYSAILVDLTDPSAPFVADFYEYPGGR